MSTILPKSTERQLMTGIMITIISMIIGVIAPVMVGTTIITVLELVDPVQSATLPRRPELHDYHPRSDPHCFGGPVAINPACAGAARRGLAGTGAACWLIILRDGDPGEPAVTLSPLMYHFQHRAELEVVVQSPNQRDALFDALCASIGALISADRTLAGRCDWIEADAPQPVDLPIEGAAALKAAVITVVLHYSSASPLA